MSCLIWSRLFLGVPGFAFWFYLFFCERLVIFDSFWAITMFRHIGSFKDYVCFVFSPENAF